MGSPVARRVIIGLLAVVIVLSGAAVVARFDRDTDASAAVATGREDAGQRLRRYPSRLASETFPPAIAPEPAAPPTTAAPEPPPAPDPAAARRERLAPYTGLGTWIDVFDWTVHYSEAGTPAFGVADVDRLADLGVQTLFVQAARYDAPTDIVEPELLVPIIERARQRGVRVVAWYLPTHEDQEADLRRLLAIASLDVDGVAVNIESTRLADPVERSRRAVELSGALRAALSDRVIAAVPLPPVVMEVVNGNYWPGFPWVELAPHYDVWLPMSYWTNRAVASPYRDAYTYTAENIDRMRANLGNAAAPCHVLGGIGDATTPADVEGMLRASSERGCIGGSVYDYRTTTDEVWTAVQPLRR